MIYDCPQCGTPQNAGRTTCPRCHAEFDGPVPSDAMIPPSIASRDVPETQMAVVAEPLLETTDAEPMAAKDAEVGAIVAEPGAIVAEASPMSEPLPAEEVLPLASETDLPAAEDAASAAEAKPSVVPDSNPYQTPPSHLPPPYVPPDIASPLVNSDAPMRPPLSGLTRMFLVAFPIVLVLVLGGVYYFSNLSTGTDTAPAPAALVQAPAPTPAASVGSPTFLQGGANTENSDSERRAKMLVGRWQAKTSDFYVFNKDGTGSRGSLIKQDKEQSFLWGLVQNRLMLYKDQNEMLRFNPGPDNNTIFVAAQTGHYIQFSRTKD